MVVREETNIKQQLGDMFRKITGGNTMSSGFGAAATSGGGSTEAAARAIAAAARASGGSLEGAKALLAQGAAAAAAAGSGSGSGAGSGGVTSIGFGAPPSTTAVTDLGVIGRGRGGGRVTLHPTMSTVAAVAVIKDGGNDGKAVAAPGASTPVVTGEEGGPAASIESNKRPKIA